MSQPQMDSELGELPNSWRVRPLGDLIDEAQYGISVKGSDEGSCPILRMTNQVNGRISPRQLQYANVSIHDVEKFGVKRFVRTRIRYEANTNSADTSRPFFLEPLPELE